MTFLPTKTCLWIALLVVLLCMLPAQQTALADAGNNNQSKSSSAMGISWPRLNAKSESYELSGTLKDSILRLRLKRMPSGITVANAQITLTVGSVSGTAKKNKGGTYQFRLSGWKKGGEQEVIIAIKDGQKQDLLVGLLREASKSGSRQHSSHDKHGSHGDRAGHTVHKDKHRHKGHGHGNENSVRLKPQVIREFGIKTSIVQPGIIAQTISRPAEVSFNQDRLAHVVPRVVGIAKSIQASQGDYVKAGNTLAILESRELAELKAAYLAARERFFLAKDNFERIEILRKKNITSEKAFLTSRSALSEARIAMRSARQKLSSVGINRETLSVLVKNPDAQLTNYELRAPISGVVIKRHLVQGELVSAKEDEASNIREAFIIADLASVWVNVSIYADDLARVRPGQTVILKTRMGKTAKSTILFVTPNLSEQTRTATARVVLKGKSDVFRPGMFIAAIIEFGGAKVKRRAPRSALQRHEGQDVVFVHQKGAFERRRVKLGRRNARHVEIISGLQTGEVIVEKGAFLIKSQLSKASFGDGHNH